MTRTVPLIVRRAVALGNAVSILIIVLAWMYLKSEASTNILTSDILILSLGIVLSLIMMAVAFTVPQPQALWTIVAIIAAKLFVSPCTMYSDVVILVFVVGAIFEYYRERGGAK